MVLYGKNIGPLSNIPLRLSLDGALGIAAITAHMEPLGPPLSAIELMAGQRNKTNPDDKEIIAIRGVMCSLLAVATNTDAPSPPTSRQLAMERESLIKHYFQIYPSLPEGPDSLFQKIIDSGKAIVIMPVTGVGKKYKGVEVNGTPQSTNSQYWAWLGENTAVVQWRGAKTGAVLRVGPDVLASNAGLRGAWFDMPVDGTKEYLLFIAEPDTYTLAGTNYLAATEAMPQLGDAQKNGRSRLGQILLQPVKSTDFYKDIEWFNAQYDDRTVREQFCSATFVMSGACAEYSTREYKVKELTNPAGWRNTVKARQIDGLRISTQFQKEVASFTVKPGEVVVVDGFAVVPSSEKLNQQACVMKEEGPQCDLKALQLLYIKANAGDMLRNSDMPQLSRLLQGAVYRPVTPKAQKGAFDGNYGQRYLIDEK